MQLSIPLLILKFKKHVLIFSMVFIQVVLIQRAFASNADAPWDLVHDDEGIVVETKLVDGSDVRAFRAMTTIDASMDAIIDILMTPASCTKWIHNCSLGRSLEKGDATNVYSYQVSDMPWPSSDRDIVLRLELVDFAEGKKVRMNSVSGLVPDESYHRIEKSNGYYELIPEEPGRTSVTWFQHTELGGNVPAWLINQLIVDLPLNSLINLRKLASSSQKTLQTFASE